MQVELDNTRVISLDDRATRRGHRVVNDPANVFNPAAGYALFIETPQVGAHPWIAFVRLDENGAPDLTGEPTRMPLRKMTITGVVA